jgi:uncharacterized protein YecT (DUF1311 family)
MFRSKSTLSEAKMKQPMRYICRGIFLVPFCLGAAICPTIALAQPQQSLNETARQAYEMQDVLLNQAYKTLYSQLHPMARTALVLSERSWIHFRDSECNFESIGTIHASDRDMILYSCLEWVTKTRIVQIQYQIDCSEGDLSCVKHTS